MPSNEYHFFTHWRVRSTVDEITAILTNGEDLPRWWPSVYLDVRQLEPGGPGGLGGVIALHTKGWLPYTLRWQAKTIAVRHPHGFTIEATGDFVGRGDWTFTQDGDWVDVAYDWRIRADKPLLRYGSALGKPLFAANHRWAMQRGEESLRLELARRHAATDTERAAIAPPPGPTTTSPLPLAVGGLATLAAGAWLVARARRRTS